MKISSRPIPERRTACSPLRTRSPEVRVRAKRIVLPAAIRFPCLAILSVVILGANALAQTPMDWEASAVPSDATSSPPWRDEHEDAARRWWDTLTDDERVAALYGDSATPDQDAAARNPYDELDDATRAEVDEAADEIYKDGWYESVGQWWETLDCRLQRVAAGDGNVEDTSSPFCAHYPGSDQEPPLGLDERAQVDEVGVALFDFPDAGIFPSPEDFEPARRWWDVLDSDQRVAALYGDGGTEQQRTAASSVYEELFSSTKNEVNDSGDTLHQDGDPRSVGEWWESLDCQWQRIAAGDGNANDPSSPFCAHYPGSEQVPLLGEEELEHVDSVGVELFEFPEPGVFPNPEDVAFVGRWWDALAAEQRVAALYGEGGSERERAVAMDAYSELFSSTKQLANEAGIELNGDGSWDSVGTWWESLDCRLQRVATGDGNEANASSPYCAHYPGSGLEPLLGDDEKQHVDHVGQALLGRDDPGIYPPPPDLDYAARWWAELTTLQRARALFGQDSTTEQLELVFPAYEEVINEIQVLVNEAATEIYGTGEYPSIGDWWQTLDCRQRRITMGTGNDDDPENVFCANYPGSGVDPILGFLERPEVDRVGVALLGVDDIGIYFPGVVERVNRVHRELFSEIARATTASTVDAVTTRIENVFSPSTQRRTGVSRDAIVASLLSDTDAKTDSRTLVRLLGESSLATGLRMRGREEESRGIGLWVSGDYRDLSSSSRRFVQFEGHLQSVHAGADIHLRPRLLAGVVASSQIASLESFEFTYFREEPGEYELSLTSVGPYFVWQNPAGRRLWFLATSGSGDVTLRDHQLEEPVVTSVSTTSGAFGSISDIFERDYKFWGAEYRTVVTFKAGGMFSSFSSDATELLDEFSGTNRRLQCSFDLSNAGGRADGFQHMVYLSLGGRNDQGWGPGASGGYREVGLTLRHKALMVRLDAHELDVELLEAEEQGARLMLEIDPGPSKKGFWLRAGPSWGNERDERFAAGELELGSPLELGSMDRSFGRRLTADFGFGLSAFQGKGAVEAFGAISGSEASGGAQRLGLRLQLLNALNLAGELRRSEPPHSTESSDLGIMLSGALRW